MTNVNWTEVANGPDLETMWQNFRDWLYAHGMRDQLDDSVIRVYAIRGEFADRRRVMVRKGVIANIGS